MARLMLLVVAGAIVALIVSAQTALPTRAASAHATHRVRALSAARARVVSLDEQSAELDALSARLGGVFGHEVSRSEAGTPVPVIPGPVAPAAPAPWIWPAPGQITGPFGERRPTGPHPGLDIDGETGDPVVLAVPGRVLWSGPAPAGFGGYGNVVIVQTADGVLTLYAHLSAWNLQPGQDVAGGARVGAIGCTGACTGSHLHFEVRVNNLPVDPQKFLPPRA